MNVERIGPIYFQHLRAMTVHGVNLDMWDSTPRLTSRQSQVYSKKVKHALDNPAIKRELRRKGVKVNNGDFGTIEFGKE